MTLSLYTKRSKTRLVRRLCASVTTALLVMLAYTNIAIADFSGNYGEGHPHMGWGDGSGMMLFGPVMMIGLVVVIVLVVVSLIQRKGHAGSGDGPSTASPLDILKERYAKGEIDHDEYDERKRKLME